MANANTRVGFEVNPLNKADVVQDVHTFANAKRRYLMIKHNHTKHKSEEAKTKDLKKQQAIMRVKRPSLIKFMSRIYWVKDKSEQAIGTYYKDMSATHVINAINYYEKTYPDYHNNLDMYRDLYALRNYFNAITTF